MRRTVENSFTSSRRKLAAALDEINTIIKFARACGITRKILFRPTMAKHAEYFRGGFMFELVKRGKHGDVLAFGGRYDSLLEHFKEPARQSLKVYGAGMSIAVDNLTRTVRKQESLVSHRLMTKHREEERSFGLWSPAVSCVNWAHLTLSAVTCTSRHSQVSTLRRVSPMLANCGRRAFAPTCSTTTDARKTRSSRSARSKTFCELVGVCGQLTSGILSLQEHARRSRSSARSVVGRKKRVS